MVELPRRPQRRLSPTEMAYEAARHADLEADSTSTPSPTQQAPQGKPESTHPEAERERAQEEAISPVQEASESLIEEVVLVEEETLVAPAAPEGEEDEGPTQEKVAQESYLPTGDEDEIVTFDRPQTVSPERKEEKAVGAEEDTATRLLGTPSPAPTERHGESSPSREEDLRLAPSDSPVEDSKLSGDWVPTVEVISKIIRVKTVLDRLSGGKESFLETAEAKIIDSKAGSLEELIRSVLTLSESKTETLKLLVDYSKLDANSRPFAILRLDTEKASNLLQLLEGLSASKPGQEAKDEIDRAAIINSLLAGLSEPALSSVEKSLKIIEAVKKV